MLNEACIRYSGYLYESGFGGVRSETLGAKSVEHVVNHAAMFRNSGAVGAVDPLQDPPGRAHRMIRYPDTITRIRTGQGSWDATGRWTPGPAAETTLAASVQPLRLSDDPTEAGDQYRDRLRVFTPWRADVPLLAAIEGGNGDKVRHGGVVFKVTETSAWPDSHVEAELLREP